MSLCANKKGKKKTVKTCISQENSTFSCWNGHRCGQSFGLLWKRKKPQNQWNRLKFFSRMGLGGGEREKERKKSPFGIWRSFSNILMSKWQLRYPHFDKDPEWKNPNTSHSPLKHVPTKAFGLCSSLLYKDSTWNLSPSKLHYGSWYPWGTTLNTDSNT